MTQMLTRDLFEVATLLLKVDRQGKLGNEVNKVNKLQKVINQVTCTIKLSKS